MQSPDSVSGVQNLLSVSMRSDLMDVSSRTSKCSAWNGSSLISVTVRHTRHILSLACAPLMLRPGQR